jgi:hypothetical protein
MIYYCKDQVPNPAAKPISPSEANRMTINQPFSRPDRKQGKLSFLLSIRDFVDNVANSSPARLACYHCPAPPRTETSRRCTMPSSPPFRPCA